MENLKNQNDRFIPDRDQIDFDLCNFKLTSNTETVNKICKMLNVENERVLPFFARSKKQFSISYPKINKEDKEHYYLSNTAFKVLDAPNALDDFYLNILDWSSTDLISIALLESVYLYNTKTLNIYNLDSLSDPEYSHLLNSMIVVIY